MESRETSADGQPAQIASSVARGLFLLLVPLTEFVAARILLRRVVSIRLHASKFGDVELILPTCLAFLLMIVILDLDYPIRPRLRNNSLLVNLACFSCFITLVLFAHFTGNSLAIWISLPLLAISCAGACLIFVPASYYFKNPNRFAIIPCVLIANAIVLYQVFFSLLWRPLCYPTGICTLQFLKLLYGDKIQAKFLGNQIQFIHDAFALNLQHGCSGVDALFLFVFCFALAMMLHPNHFRRLGWLLAGLVGLSLMFLTNAFRITLFFWIAVQTNTRLPLMLSGPIDLGLFHSHVGWILYAIVLTTYFSFLFRIGRRPSTSP